MREANTLPYYERTPSGLNERLCAVEKKMMDMKPMKNMTDYMEPLHEGGCDCAVYDDIEMRNHLKQITQTANNFYDAWSSLYDHCKELTEINQRLEAEYSAKVVELTGRNDFYRRMLLMTCRIRCYDCGAETYADGAVLACKACHDALKQQLGEAERLLAEANKRWENAEDANIAVTAKLAEAKERLSRYEN